MKTYLYPQNLRATANLWLWSLKDFAIMMVAALLAVLLLVNTGFFAPVVAVFIFAFVTIRLEDVTVLDFLRYAVKFFLSAQQHFEWRADSVRGQSARRAVPVFVAKPSAPKHGGEKTA
jgi:hypothetical protein